MYASLPDEVQRLTENGFLPYSTAKRMKLLADAYEQNFFHRYGHDATELAKQRYVVDGLLGEAQMLKKQQLLHMDARKRFDANTWIDARVQDIVDSTKYALFDLEADAPLARRRQAAKALTKQAFVALQTQMEIGDCDRDTLWKLREQIDRLLHEDEDQDEDRDAPAELSVWDQLPVSNDFSLEDASWYGDLARSNS